jgi:predicted metal-dependent peptidase
MLVEKQKQNQNLLEDCKVALESALHDIRFIRDSGVGNVLQTLNIIYVGIKTLAVSINDLGDYTLAIDPHFFIKIQHNERIALLLHEVYHIIFGHLSVVPFKDLSKEDIELYNIACDMSINQYIVGLPENAINVERFKYKDKNTGEWESFPKEKHFEIYYDLLKNYETLPKPSKKDSGKGTGECPNCGGKLEPTTGNGGQSDGKGKKKAVSSCKCPKCGTEYGGIQIDNHDSWDKAQELGELEAIKATERMIVKTGCDYSKLPGGVKDFMEYAKKTKAKLNYKALIKKAIRMTLSGGGRKSTWRRPNRKYGSHSKGRKIGNLPLVHFFIDTSGSISVDEMNEFVSIIMGCCRAFNAKTKGSMFHTSVYKTKTFTRSTKLNDNDIESGGTDLTDVMKTIADQKPDVSVILTDGGYCDVDVESMVGYNGKFPPTTFVITKDGIENHKLKRVGNTIKIPS